MLNIRGPGKKTHAKHWWITKEELKVPATKSMHSPQCHVFNSEPSECSCSIRRINNHFTSPFGYIIPSSSLLLLHACAVCTLHNHNENNNA